MGEIDINGFGGMNNLNPEFYAGKGGIVSPKIICNADVDASGVLTVRDGLTLYIALPGAHSLWSCPDCMLVVARNVLYRIVNGAKAAIGAISGRDGEPLSYEQVGDWVYISNRYWRAKFNHATNTLHDWGVALPPGPMMVSTSGGLPTGTYHVCMTNVVSGEMSGNGQIVDITLTAAGGIQVLNRPSGAIVWATDSNEPIFYKIGAVDTFDEIPTIEPLPGFLCGPPQNMTVITYAFGRIWGAVDNYLYYSEPNNLGLFHKEENRFKFDSDVNLIARVSTGLFIGMEDQTRFLSGSEPGQMVESYAGAGSIRGTLAYCNNVPYLADKLGTPEKVFVDVPIWRTKDGIVAGNASGRLFNLSKDKLKMGAINKGASLYRNLNGSFQFLTSSMAGVGGVDPDTASVFEAGHIPKTNIAHQVPTSGLSFSEEVTCEVWRNGVLMPD